MHSKHLFSYAIVFNELCNAHTSFISRVPNGDNVEVNGRVVGGIGHRGFSGGGTLNEFGRDFSAEGYKWSKALCEKDSDCDGKSNGEELGDPLCEWTRGQTPKFVVGITHPGFNDGGSCEKYVEFKNMSTWLQIHVLSLYFSWGFLLPLGVLIPMCFREAFDDKAMWFKIHQVSQMTGVLLMLIGCIVVFVNAGTHLNGVHKILGLVVLIFALLQPLNAIFRPGIQDSEDGSKSKSQGRYIWEMVHKNGGRLVIILAWVNVFLGIRLLRTLHGAYPTLCIVLEGVQGFMIAALTAVALWRMKSSGHKKDSDHTGNIDDSKSPLSLLWQKKSSGSKKDSDHTANIDDSRSPLSL